MKKAYNEIWVQNLEIQQITKTWVQKNLLSNEQFEAIKTQFFEGFYRPNIFVRIALFIFGLIACSFFFGFLSLLFFGIFNTNAPSKTTEIILSFICAISFFLILEFLISKRNLYHSGIDNVLLYSVIAALIYPIFALFDNLENWQYCLVILLFFLIATWRYADIFVAGAAYFSLLALVATFLVQFPLGKALLPFVLMLLSAVIYYLNKKQKYSYYTDCQEVIEFCSLITFYLAGNYFIVREGNAILNHSTQNPSPQIAFAALFYIFTATIPFIYIVLGLRRKDRKLLIIGLLAVGFSIFSYRFYFAIFSIEWALILGGILLISIAITAINYLKKPTFGISDEEDNEHKISDLGSILVSQTIMQNTASPTKNIELGGGEMGGGGAGGEY